MRYASVDTQSAYAVDLGCKLAVHARMPFELQHTTSKNHRPPHEDRTQSSLRERERTGERARERERERESAHARERERTGERERERDYRTPEGRNPSTIPDCVGVGVALRDV